MDVTLGISLPKKTLADWQKRARKQKLSIDAFIITRMRYADVAEGLEIPLLAETVEDLTDQIDRQDKELDRLEAVHGKARRLTRKKRAGPASA